MFHVERLQTEEAAEKCFLDSHLNSFCASANYGGSVIKNKQAYFLRRSP